MGNVFSKISKVNLKTSFHNNKVILDDVYFTAPFKIMSPFYKSNDYIKVVLMSSSAGIMAGDVQEFNIEIGENTKVELTSQAYEKIHKMKSGKAIRTCNINVNKNALLKYSPQQTIPFSKSSFDSNMIINLEDKTSKLILTDIISCGRATSGEKFQYDLYKSYIEVKCNNRLIYRDNTIYIPEIYDMKGYGFFEGYTHLANIFVCNIESIEEKINTIRDIINENKDISGGGTLTKYNNLSIKILGKSGQILSNICENILSLISL